MNATLAIPARLRCSLSPWLGLLLLPALPCLVLLGPGASHPFGYDALASLAMVFLLAGIALAAGMPLLLRLLSRPWRKEIEQLRGAWILSAFLVQFPLVFAPDGGEVVFVLLAIASALLGSIPFGAEYQQRTIAGLLTQPVDRRLLWRRKIVVLGIALLLLGILVTISFAAFPDLRRNLSGPAQLATTLLILSVALGTAPWWSLLTRAILPGTVFALSAPLAAWIAGVAALDLLRASAAFDEWYLGNWHRFDSLLFALCAFGLLPAYAVLAAILARRRWLALEVPDSHSAESGAFFGGRLGSRTATDARPRTRRRSPITSLLIKECRLQTVTWGLGLLVVVLTFAFFRPADAELSERYRDTQEYLAAAVCIFAPLTLLLAGATAISEERRLGTLDPQVLLPLSRGLQWSIKLAVVLATGVVMGLCVWSVLQENLRSPASDSVLYGFLVVLLGCAIIPFFASSASPNTLRALLVGLALLLIALVIVVAGVGFEERLIGRATSGFRETTEMKADAWRAEAATLDPKRVQVLSESVARPIYHPGAFLRFVFLSAGGTLLIALFLSWRHFAIPSSTSTRRFALESLALLAVLLGLTAGTLTYLGLHATRQARAETLLLARESVDYLASLRPAQLQLAKRAERNLLPLHQPLYYSFWIWTNSPPPSRPPATPPPQGVPLPRAPRWTHRSFQFPLAEADLRLIVERGLIPDDLREALRQEAGLEQGAHPDLPPPPSAQVLRGANGLRLSPELMRRYGLLPSAESEADPNPNLPTPQPPAAAPGPQAAPRHQMSPELMRRYGLTPDSQPAPTPNPNPSP